MPWPTDEELNAQEQLWAELWKAERDARMAPREVDPNKPIVLEAPSYWMPGIKPSGGATKSIETWLELRPRTYKEALRNWHLRGIEPHASKETLRTQGIKQKLDPRDISFGTRSGRRGLTQENLREKVLTQIEKNVPLSEKYLKTIARTSRQTTKPMSNSYPYISKIKIIGQDGKEQIQYIPGLNQGHSLDQIARKMGPNYKYEVIDTFRNPAPLRTKVTEIISTGGQYDIPIADKIGKEISRMGQIEAVGNVAQSAVGAQKELAAPSTPWSSGDVGRGVALHSAAEDIEKAKIEQYRSGVPENIIDLAGENLRNRLYPPRSMERMPIRSVENIKNRLEESRRLRNQNEIQQGWIQLFKSMVGK